MESSQWENLNHLFCRKVSFLSDPHCRFRGVGQGMKQTYLYIMQNGKPIASASKSLTQSEINYAQIEKEMFAILLGCKHFHKYVYSRKVHVESDHKPVRNYEQIISCCTRQTTSMMLQLQRYELILHHLSGKSIHVADTLSRKSTFILHTSNAYKL
jgi:hypothetical protein